MPLTAPLSIPPAAALANPQGRAPVLLLCDHASSVIPAELGDLGLSADDRYKHIAWDIGAFGVARRMAAAFDAPLAHAGYSRLVVDCNRRPDDPDCVPPVSDGIPVPGNEGLSPAARAERIARYHTPYHELVDARIAQFRAASIEPAIIAVHSCTPVMNGFARPWHVGVLWNRDDRISAPLLKTLGGIAEYCIGDNQPYTGRGEAGYSIPRHAEDNALPHVMLEIRQDLIEDEAGQEVWATILIDALRPILASLRPS